MGAGASSVCLVSQEKASQADSMACVSGLPEGDSDLAARLQKLEKMEQGLEEQLAQLRDGMQAHEELRAQLKSSCDDEFWYQESKQETVYDETWKHMIEHDGAVGELPDLVDASSNSVATSSRFFAAPSQTLIFLDWDDTIFPTTEVFDRWRLPSRKELWGDLEISPEQQQVIDRWQEAAYQYLSTARGLSDRCVIVTNAVRPWVQDTVERFAPRLAPLFDWSPSCHGGADSGSRAKVREGGDDSCLLRVVYAREAMTRRDKSQRPTSPCARCLTEEEHDDRLTAWKCAAMSKEVREFYSRYPEQTWKNVLSIGDARYEHDAIQEVTFRRKSPSREQLRTKAIILWPEPSITDMTIWLQKSQLLLPAYVRFDGDMDVDLSVPFDETQHPLADVLRLPELRDVLRVRGEGAATTLDEDLETMTMALQRQLSPGE